MSHYLPYFAVRAKGGLVAVCGADVESVKDISGAPTCPGCQAWLADDAALLEELRAMPPSPTIVKPEFDPCGDYHERRPKKLTRQERLEGLADRGCDTWQELRSER